MAYGIAAGAFSLFDALVGLVAAFVPAIPWVVMAVLDALTAILLLAHGIVSCMKANGTKSCDQQTNYFGRILLFSSASVLEMFSSEGLLAREAKQTRLSHSSVSSPFVWRWSPSSWQGGDKPPVAAPDKDTKRVKAERN